jgi:microcystin-dependent protein
MTVTNTERSVSYTLNGSTLGPFSVPFQFFEVDVYLDGAVVDPSDYQIVQEDVGGTGDILFLTEDEPTGELAILGATALVQETDYVNNDDFPAESHERALDRLTMIVQDLKRNFDRCILAANPYLGATLNFREHPGAFFFVDEDGEPTLTPNPSFETAAAQSTSNASSAAASAATAVEAAAIAIGALPSGAMIPYLFAAAPTGWVRGNGLTIGSATSGATERANVDTQSLYVKLWNEWDNTLLPIQDSDGIATTRGVNAAADFAANKRLPLPDGRGRAIFGTDDMGNSPAGRLGSVIAAATTIGASGGSETCTLITANLPVHAHDLNNHTHTFTTGTESAGHTHSGSGVTSTDGAHDHSFTYNTIAAVTTGAGTYVANIQPAGGGNPTTVASVAGHAHNYSFTTSTQSATHTHSGTTDAASGNTGNTGSGSPHSNLPPALLVPFIIKL